MTAGAGGSVQYTQSHYLGSSATITATPDLGYLFTGWNGDASGSDNPITLRVDSDKTIEAVFAQDNDDTDGDG